MTLNSKIIDLPSQMYEITRKDKVKFPNDFKRSSKKHKSEHLNFKTIVNSSKQPKFMLF